MRQHKASKRENPHPTEPISLYPYLGSTSTSTPPNSTVLSAPAPTLVNHNVEQPNIQACLPEYPPPAKKKKHRKQRTVWLHRLSHIQGTKKSDFQLLSHISAHFGDPRPPDPRSPECSWQGAHGLDDLPAIGGRLQEQLQLLAWAIDEGDGGDGRV